MFWFVFLCVYHFFCFTSFSFMVTHFCVLVCFLVWLPFLFLLVFFSVYRFIWFSSVFKLFLVNLCFCVYHDLLGFLNVMLTFYVASFFCYITILFVMLCFLKLLLVSCVCCELLSYLVFFSMWSSPHLIVFSTFLSIIAFRLCYSVVCNYNSLFPPCIVLCFQRFFNGMTGDMLGLPLRRISCILRMIPRTQRRRLSTSHRKHKEFLLGQNDNSY